MWRTCSSSGKQPRDDVDITASDRGIASANTGVTCANNTAVSNNRVTVAMSFRRPRRVMLWYACDTAIGVMAPCASCRRKPPVIMTLRAIMAPSSANRTIARRSMRRHILSVIVVFANAFAVRRRAGVLPFM